MKIKQSKNNTIKRNEKKQNKKKTKRQKNVRKEEWKGGEKEVKQNKPASEP